LFAEIIYTPEDLRLRVRIVSYPDGEERWIREVSTAEVLGATEKVRERGEESLDSDDSLSHVLLGEIAFTTVIGTGIAFLPSVNKGGGSSGMLYPAVDLFIGEKYDRGRKRFGFLIGANVNMMQGDTLQGSSPLPFGIRIAPQFRYTFNPYNISSARWSLSGEVGGFLSSGLVTGYFGLGFEVAMMQRFSISVTPMYILPANVSSGTVQIQQPDGSFQPGGSNAIGTYGGFGTVAEVKINW
jgi:hypothetical protein